MQWVLTEKPKIIGGLQVFALQYWLILLLLSFLLLLNIGILCRCMYKFFYLYFFRIGVVSSLGCYYLCLYIFSIGVVSASGETKLPHFLFNMFNDYWNLLIIISLSFVALIPDFMHRYITKNFYLEDWEIINIIENSK